MVIVIILIKKMYPVNIEMNASTINNKYSNGKIYILNCIDNYYYIGSTILELSYRLSNHKFLSKKTPDRNVYKHINTIGWDNVIIELLEDYSCKSKRELNEREDYYIKHAKDNNDIYCLNLNRAYTTKLEKKENIKQYYENNKEKILNYAKSYREENKEKIKNYKDFYNIINSEKRNNYTKQYTKENEEKVKEGRKRYYLENKEEITQKNKEYVEKNKELVAERKKTWVKNNKEHIKEHSKQKRIENKDKIKEKGKEYYEKNKDSILEKNRIYQEKNKEKLKAQQAEYRAAHKNIIECECGAIITELKKIRHINTKKHIKYLDSKTYLFEIEFTK